jgi:hypothetical protein
MKLCVGVKKDYMRKLGHCWLRDSYVYATRQDARYRMLQRAVKLSWRHNHSFGLPHLGFYKLQVYTGDNSDNSCIRYDRTGLSPIRFPDIPGNCGCCPITFCGMIEDYLPIRTWPATGMLKIKLTKTL